MPPASPNKRNLRLPQTLAKRLQGMADERGISENAYLTLALEEKLDDDEERLTRRTEPEKRRKKDGPGPGLGLGLRRPPAQGEPPRPAPEPAPVVVNVGTRESPAPASGGSLVQGLCDFVLQGSAFERERRQHQALVIIRAHGRTAEEQRELTRLLEQALSEAAAPAPGGFRSAVPIGRIGSLFR